VLILRTSRYNYE